MVCRYRTISSMEMGYHLLMFRNQPTKAGNINIGYRLGCNCGRISGLISIRSGYQYISDMVSRITYTNHLPPQRLKQQGHTSHTPPPTTTKIKIKIQQSMYRWTCIRQPVAKYYATPTEPEPERVALIPIKLKYIGYRRSIWVIGVLPIFLLVMV